VALARALANKPKVLLLDEPLSALDAKIRVSLRSEIKTLQRELGINHHLRDARPGRSLSMSTGSWVMNEGNAEQSARRSTSTTIPAPASSPPSSAR